MHNRYADPAFGKTIARLKQELKQVRQQLDETDKKYPRIQKIIDTHWDD